MTRVMCLSRNVSCTQPQHSSIPIPQSSLLPAALLQVEYLQCKFGHPRLSLLGSLSLTTTSQLATPSTMAVGETPSSPPQAAVAPQPIDIEAWTEQATAALGSVTITTPEGVVAGTSVTLAIPLDEHDAPPAHTRPAPATAAKEGGYLPRKAPLRRDSLKRREALLKGNEGSRRRQRWENGTSQRRFAQRCTPPRSPKDNLEV